MRDAHQLLRTTLRANAAFSGISGIAILLGSNTVAGLIGLASGSDLYPTGLSLLGFSAWLFWMAARPTIPWRQAAAAATLDWLWVAASLPIVFGAVGFVTGGGRWLVGLIALAVADFAALQTWALLRLRHPPRAV